ncbi:S8 family peptidase [Sphingobium algorifonticola]|uniref:Peptidase S8 n=1 Tax=Sphingobium algorifonticola TaxID=2008318 RepID=A0A437J8C1_9SPHN|nr:S8 family peptidase [Sphingobium algorifonticola]RVT41744.1 peptidase S8 [Sphingobium algorifonticola]
MFRTAEYERSDGPVAHGAVTAYEAGASGAGVTVGIIDSGIATANVEFTGRISAASRDFAGNDTIEDADGHGTAVATVLAAARNDRRTLGVAWGATILALRTDSPNSCAAPGDGVTESGCSHGTTAIAQALDHARTNGARVVNISLGGGGIPANLRAAVDRATAAGVIIVVSAGNDAQAAPDAFATSIVDAGLGRGLVIIAGSVDADGIKSSYANGAQGYEQATLSALGSRVLSQDNSGEQFRYTGTSFSAPQIAGAAALLAQAFPNLTGAQIVDLLLRSATDAGTSGADALYGRGVLNIARAFAPVGSTSLAGSAQPVSLDNNAALSSAMGDATGQSAARVAITDSYGRAYAMDLGQTFAQASPRLSLAPSLQSMQRNIAATAGPMAVAMTIAPGGPALDRVTSLTLTGRDARQARLLSGSVISRLGRDTFFALGLSQGAAGLVGRIAGAAQPAFLVSGDARETLGFAHGADGAVAVRQMIGLRTAITATSEQGHVWDGRNGLLPIQAEQREQDRARYARFGVAIDRQAGDWQLGAGLSFLREDATLLGARFGPAIGGVAGRSLFLDLSTRYVPDARWSVGLAWRQGWTRATVAAEGRARLTSNGWTVDGERRGLFVAADRLAVRLSQPLRVESGGLTLNLPTEYDYATGMARSAPVTLGLAPRGRQIDGEAVYAIPVGAGWMSSNLYWRRQSGNLAWFPDDIGGAMRYTIGF